MTQEFWTVKAWQSCLCHWADQCVPCQQKELHAPNLGFCKFSGVQDVCLPCQLLDAAALCAMGGKRAGCLLAMIHWQAADFGRVYLPCAFLSLLQMPLAVWFLL